MVLNKKDLQELRKKNRQSSFPVVCALILVIASVAYIVCRTMSDRAYNEKWKDYDECGLS